MLDRSYYVYILASRRRGTLYVGVTNDLRRRVFEHKNDLVDGFTQKYKVKLLVWFEVTESVEAAIDREKQIKKWNRGWKIELIEKRGNDTLATARTTHEEQDKAEANNMSILINKSTRVVTQGITGKTGQFHTRMCRDYANGKNCFVAGVNPKKAGEDFEGIPIYASVKEAKDKQGVNASVIYVPPPGAAAAIWEAVEADLDLVICITEGIPVRDMIEVRDRMRKEHRKTILVGPNCPGVITPEEIKIGIMPGHIHRKGRIECRGHWRRPGQWPEAHRRAQALQ
jgi:predicted GIY-YIG superfamily endonuclease/predicted CoA-binding protein